MEVWFTKKTCTAMVVQAVVGATALPSLVLVKHVGGRGWECGGVWVTCSLYTTEAAAGY